MLCRTKTPFNIVTTTGFVDFIKSIGSRLTIKDVTNYYRKYLPELYEKVKKCVLADFTKDILTLTGVAFTTDMWTSRNNDAFSALICHYISQLLEFKSFLVRMETFRDEKHCGEAIAIQFDALIDNLNLLPKEQTHR